MAGTYQNVKINHPYEAWFLVQQGKGIRKITKAVADDARAGCPTDSYDLVLSVRELFPGNLEGWVVVGTDHWEPTEYGSPPHLIVSHGRWSLRSDDDEYFGRVVHHPGTPEQPFMRPALYRRRRPDTGRVV